MTELRCGKCGAFLARVIEVDGKYYLDAGTRLEYASHGVCTCCKEPYHWTGNDEIFRRLMNGRVKITG